MATLVATAGAANANSYVTLVEAVAYFDTRLSANAWDSAEDQTKALIMATRVLDMMAQPHKRYIPPTSVRAGFFITSRTWTGAVASTTQRLAWPRTGMFDRNGNALATDEIPQDLKEATAELAMQLATEDRTLDSDIEAQGITSLKAGSVALTFKDSVQSKVLPDAVLNLMPASWLTEEVITSPPRALFQSV